MSNETSPNLIEVLLELQKTTQRVYFKFYRVNFISE